MFPLRGTCIKISEIINAYPDLNTIHLFKAYLTEILFYSPIFIQPLPYFTS